MLPTLDVRYVHELLLLLALMSSDAPTTVEVSAVLMTRLLSLMLNTLCVGLGAVLVEQILTLVGLFIRSVAAGDTIQATCHSSSRALATLVAKTLVGYASTAAAWLEFHFGKRPPLYLPASASAQPRLHPFLAETIAQHWDWQ